MTHGVYSPYWEMRKFDPESEGLTVEDLERITEWAEGTGQNKSAVEAYIYHVGIGSFDGLSALLDSFEEAYMGETGSLIEFAEYETQGWVHKAEQAGIPIELLCPASWLDSALQGGSIDAVLDLRDGHYDFHFFREV